MGASVEEIRKHQKIYLMVFAALAVLTCVTVAVARLDLGVGAAVAVAMLVAGVKGTLVACYFMHLVSERGMIFWILGLCAFFFIVLLLLPSMTQFEPSHAGPGS